MSKIVVVIEHGKVTQVNELNNREFGILNLPAADETTAKRYTDDINQGLHAGWEVRHEAARKAKVARREAMSDAESFEEFYHSQCFTD